MPVWNWFKLHKTNNFTYLRKKPTLNIEFSKGLANIWDDLNDQFMSRYGMTEEFKQLLRLKKQRINQLSDYVIQNDYFKLTEADLTTVEIDQIMQKGEDITNEETIILIEQQMGFKINPMEITVTEYYDYLNFINKKIKAENNGQNI